MEQTKQEILNNLWAIRSGLSIISNISKKSQEAELTVKNAEESIASLNSRLENFESAKDKQVNSKLLDLEYNKTKAEDSVNRLKIITEKNTFDYKKTKNSACITIFSLISVGIICLVIFFISGGFMSGISDLFPIASISLYLAFISFLIFVAILRKKKKLIKQSETNFNNQTILAKQKIYDLEKNIEDLQNMKSSTNEIEKEKDNITDKIKKYEKLRINAIKIIIKEVKHFNIVYSTMDNLFTSFLDEQCWENVDLIINYFRENKIKNLEEGLMQIDIDQLNGKLEYNRNVAVKILSYNRIPIETKLKFLDDSIRDSFNKLKVEDNEDNFVIETAALALSTNYGNSSYYMARDLKYMKDLSNRTFYN